MCDTHLKQVRVLCIFCYISASLDDEGATGGLPGDEQSLKHWFSKLRELRSEVEKIRNIMCNKYAKDMGDNLNCATQ